MFLSTLKAWEAIFRYLTPPFSLYGPNLRLWLLGCYRRSTSCRFMPKPVHNKANQFREAPDSPQPLVICYVLQHLRL